MSSRSSPPWQPTRIRDDDVLLAVTTLSFDIAGLEMWLPLTRGGKVVIAGRADVLDGRRLIAMLLEHRVTVMQATPATWRLMLDAGWSGKADLRVLCGGEALPRPGACAGRSGWQLWNMRSDGNHDLVDREPCASKRRTITVGRPIANTTIYVLDPSGQPAPIGVAGELCIGGAGVARGYHERPDLTAEKFVTLTLPTGLARVYRTGDVARLLADGASIFLVVAIIRSRFVAIASSSERSNTCWPRNQASGSASWRCAKIDPATSRWSAAVVEQSTGGFSADDARCTARQAAWMHGAKPLHAAGGVAVDAEWQDRPQGASGTDRG